MSTDLTRPIPAITLKALDRVSRYFDTQLYDAHKIPEGGVLIVGNHALAGIDALALMPKLYDATGRAPRGLGLKALFDVPVLKNILEECGAVAGERKTACELLEAQEMVVVYPGGAKDSLKTRSERYRLKWDGRNGFAHVAIKTGKPIVPIAGIGPDEVFPILTSRGLRVPWLNNQRVPLFLPLARRVPFRFYVGDPIYPPEHTLETDSSHFAREVSTALQNLIDRGLKERP